MRQTFLGTLRVLCACLALFYAQTAGAQSSPSVPIYRFDPLGPLPECGAPLSCMAWKTFRTNYPLPYQTFALAREGNEAVIILSEPPPSLSRAELALVLQAVFADDLIDTAYYRMPTGIDGWLEDTVVRVRVQGDESAPVFSGVSMSMKNAPAGIVDRLRLIHILLYDTIDGFWIDAVDASRPPSTITELQVSAADIDDWLKNETQSWSPLSPAVAKSTWSKIKSAPTLGVYERDAGGLVALTIPKAAHLDVLRADFRRFSVASDLLLGGLRHANGGLVLLARKRATPIALLPPLRFETLASFARNRSAEVAQSYERRRIFAGRIQHGELAGWDWAPILLSLQLEDTEFGTLLNLADQVLKSWSEHGRISYFAFNYPAPSEFPFGEEAATDVFFREFSTTSLVFNWNTRLFATLTESGTQQTITADRTGALPILYIPGDALLEIAFDEDTGEQAKVARDYFGSRGDPILTRVTQNVLLYQAVQSLFKTADAQAPDRKSRSDRVAAALQGEAARWIEKVTNPAAADQFDAEARTVALQFIKKSGMSPAQLAEIVSSPQSVERRFNDHVSRLNSLDLKDKALDSEYSALYEEAKLLFISTCTSLGGTLSPDRSTCNRLLPEGTPASQGFEKFNSLAKQVKKAEEAALVVESEIKKEVEILQKMEADFKRGLEVGEILAKTSGEAELDGVLERVLKVAATPETTESIRTPSVVLSKNTENTAAIGGHNIGLIPSRVRVSAKAKGPSWASGGDTPVLVLPPNRLRSASTLQRNIDASLPIVQPEPQGIETVLKSDAKGSLLEEMRRVSTASSTRLEAVEAKASLCECDALISQGADGSIVLVRPGPPPASNQIFGKSGILEALSAPPPLQVVRFEGMSRSTVENIVQTAQLMAQPSVMRDRGIGGLFETLGGMFRRSDSAATDVISITRPGKSAEVLEITAEQGAKASLRQALPWRTAKTEISADDIWAREFDVDPRELEGSEGVIVRFSSIDGAVIEPLGIRVKAEATPPESLRTRLLAAVNSWLGGRPTKPMALGEGLVSLRAEIKKRLPETEKLMFFYRRNAKKIRAAELKQKIETVAG